MHRNQRFFLFWRHYYRFFFLNDYRGLFLAEDAFLIDLLNRNHRTDCLSRRAMLHEEDVDDRTCDKGKHTKGDDEAYDPHGTGNTF